MHRCIGAIFEPQAPGLDLPFVPLLAPLVLQQVVAVGRPAPVHRDGGRLVQARACDRAGLGPRRFEARLEATSF
eukprot:1146856-Pyramimonas_sp.AAC.1